ncbi:MAG: glycosyltransferase [Desulfovibrio sp.]|nr:glycosyltransferase [Desulfovibrio sp.]
MHHKSSLRPARVVLLLQDLQVGGTQRQALELAARLDRARYAPELWTMMAGQAMLARSGVPGLPGLQHLADVPVRQLSPLPFVGPDAVLRLGLELARRQVDVLLCLTAVPNIWGRVWGQMCRRLGRRPVILGTCRGGGAPVRQHERRLWAWADHHLSNTHAMARVLTRDYGVPAAHISVIHNGVDTQRFRMADGPDADANADAGRGPVFVHLARLVEDKDHATSLRAFASLLQMVPQAELRLVGDGPRRAELETLAACLFPGQLRSRVHFAGERLDVDTVLRQADALVLSSIREAMPNVILEAMATGLPVIATDVGGVAEMVVQGETGWLTPAEDAPAMAQAMLRLAREPALRKRMGRAGRARVEAHFSFEAMARGHEAVFARLLAQRHGRAG